MRRADETGAASQCRVKPGRADGGLIQVLHRIELGHPTLPAVKGRIGGLDQFIMALIAAELSVAGGDCAIRDRGTLL